MFIFVTTGLLDNRILNVNVCIFFQPFRNITSKTTLQEYSKRQGNYWDQSIFRSSDRILAIDLGLPIAAIFLHMLVRKPL